MKRSLAMFVLAAATMLAVPLRASAATETPKVKAAPILELAPTELTVAVAPGSSAAKSVVVRNHSATDTIRVRLRARTADASPAPGATTTQPPSPGATPAQWITIGDAVVVLEPGTARRVALDVVVPTDAATGVARAAIIAEVEQKDRRSHTDAPSATALVAITVTGRAIPALSIADVRPEHRDGKYQLAVDLRNGGSAPTTASVVVAAPALRFTTTFRASVAARSKRTVRVTWTPPDKNTYEVNAKAEYGGGDTAAWDGKLARDGAPKKAPAPKPKQNVTTKAHSTGAQGSSWTSLVLPIAAVILFACAAGWLTLEASRRQRRREATVAALAVRSVNPTGIQAETFDSLGDRIGALTAAIEGLSYGFVPSPSPADYAEAGADWSGGAADGDSGAATRPATPVVSRRDHDDAFSWPSEEQLDQWVQRRAEPSGDPWRSDAESRG